MAWRYIRQYNDKTLTLRKIYEYASELRKFSHFHILKLLFPLIFCWYFWYFISETYIFSCLKLHLHAYYTINAVSFYYLWYGAMYKWQYTDKTLTSWKSMYMWASGASELRTFWHFYILKVLFPSIFCWYFRYFVGTNDMLVGLPCTDKFPNVPTKLRKSIIGGGGGASEFNNALVIFAIISNLQSSRFFL